MLFRSRSIYFTDPNGIALEASWWVHDATAADEGYADPGRFADPNPVAAVRELAQHGTLVGPLPATTLV